MTRPYRTRATHCTTWTTHADRNETKDTKHHKPTTRSISRTLISTPLSSHPKITDSEALMDRTLVLISQSGARTFFRWPLGKTSEEKIVPLQTVSN
jgi:hypothetical protein